MSDPYSAEEIAALVTELYGDEPAGLARAELSASYQNAYRVLYLQAYRELCEIVTGEAPSADPPDEEWFAERVLAFLREQGDRLYDAICVRFKYCERRQYVGISVRLLIIIAQALTGYWGWKLAPACWLVLSGILDRFCGCVADPQVRVRTIPENI
jgi:hypothetical protein